MRAINNRLIRLHVRSVSAQNRLHKHAVNRLVTDTT